MTTLPYHHIGVDLSELLALSIIGLAGALTHGGNLSQIFVYLLPALSIQPTSQHEAVEAEN